MNARAFTVTSQQQTRNLDRAGTLVDMLEVYYDGPAGISGMVRVAKAQATADYVDRLIREQLDEQLRIAQLGGPT